RSCLEETMVKRLMGTSNDVSLTTLRVVLGVVFFAHGAQRMLGWFGGDGFQGTMGALKQTGMPAPVALLIICAQFFGTGTPGRIAHSHRLPLNCRPDDRGDLHGSPAERLLYELDGHAEGRGNRISSVGA